MRTLYLFFFILFLHGLSSAQDEFKHNRMTLETNVIGYSCITYDYTIPIQKKVHGKLGAGYYLGTGFGWGSHWIIPELGLKFFGPHHFIEVGILYIQNLNTEVEEDPLLKPGFRTVYNYQSKWGLGFIATLNLFFDKDDLGQGESETEMIPYPSVGLSYHF